MGVLDAVDLSTWETAGRLGLGAGLGAVLGAERELDGHDAGVRTHALLALGAAAFGAISVGSFSEFVTSQGATNVQVDITRISSYVVAGVGFLAGGTIIKHGRRVRGLTTAGSLWAASAVGLACGVGFYSAGIITAVAAVVLLLFDLPLQRVARTRQRDASVHVTVQSMPAARDVLAQVREAHRTASQVATEKRDDGVCLTIGGLRPDDAERLVSTLSERDDVTAVSVATDP